MVNSLELLPTSSKDDSGLSKVYASNSHYSLKWLVSKSELSGYYPAQLFLFENQPLFFVSDKPDVNNALGNTLAYGNVPSYERSTSNTTYQSTGNLRETSNDEDEELRDETDDFVRLTPNYGAGEITAGYPTDPVTALGVSLEPETIFYRKNLSFDFSTGQNNASPNITGGSLFPGLFTVFEAGLAGGNNVGAAVTANGSIAAAFNGIGQIHFINNTGVLPYASDGLPVTYVIVDDVLTAVAGGQPVFTVELHSDGTFTFELTGNINHTLSGAGDDGLELDLTDLVLLTDGNGQNIPPLSDGFIIHIQDDEPLVAPVNNAVFTVHEDALPGAVVDVVNPVSQVTGTIATAVSFGADGIGGFSFLPFPDLIIAFNDLGLTSDGQPLVLNLNGNVIEVDDSNGVPVFTLVLNNDGSFIFTLQNNIDHPVATDNTVLDINLGVLIIATDGDGDSVTLDQMLIINIADDTPSAALTGAQPNTIVASEDSLNTIVTTALAGAFNFSGGADGVGAINYQLQINNPNSGLIDTLSGQPVVLVFNGTTIEGIADNEVVFTIEIDGNGVLSFNLLRPVIHPDGSDPNDVIDFPANIVNVIATLTDGDGDTSTAVLDLGSIIDIVDEGPDLAATGVNPGTIQVDENALGVPDSISMAGVFTLTQNADGPTLTYELQITGGDGTDSGLIDSLTGLPVLLRLDSQGNVEGYVNNNIVFLISIDSQGELEFTQFRTVIHPDGNGANDISIPAGLINLIGTATDGDGDSVTQSVEVGSLITIIDSLPSLNVDASQPAELSVNENNLGVNASISLVPAFTSATGADGVSAVINDYTLQVINSNSGLIVSTTGDAIILSIVGGVIEGRTAISDDLALTIAVQNDGTLTFTQLLPIEHAPGSGTNTQLFAPDTIQVTATVHDNDNDQQIAELDLSPVISIVDDIPVVQLTGAPVAPISLDEANLNSLQTVATAGAFNLLAGADGAALGYSLVINNSDSGLVDTLNGEPVLFTNNAGVIEGRADGELVLTISIAADGTLSVTLLRAVEHPDGAGDNSVLLDANVLLLVATGTDGDGDVVSAQLDVRDLLTVVDDVPLLVGGAEVIATVHEDALAGANVNTVNPVAVVSGTLATAVDLPADGGQFVFLGEPALTTAFDALDLTVDGQPLTFDLVGTTLTASDAASQPVFTLQVNTDGSYTFTLLANLDHPQVTADAMLPIDFGALLLAIDGDGDRVSLSQAFVVQVADDTPLVELTGTAITPISLDEANLNSLQTVATAGAFNLLAGADGATLAYSLVINNSDSGLVDTLNGEPVLFTNNAGIIEGRADGELVLTISIAADGTLV